MTARKQVVFPVERVPYRWTAHDAWVVEKAPKVLPTDPKEIQNWYVTPYHILPGKLSGDRTHKDKDKIDVPLKASNEIWSVERFVVDGYTWEPIPPQVGSHKTIADLCNALYAFSNDRYDRLRLSGRSAYDQNMVAMLLFDYWENYEHRYAVTSSGFDRNTLKKAGTIEVEKNGVKLLKVLTKKPSPGKVIGGVPKPADPAPKPPDPPKAADPPKDAPKPPDQPSAKVILDSMPSVYLDGLFSQTLEPMKIGEWKLGSSKLSFTIRLQKPARKTRIRVYYQYKTLLYEEEHTSGDLITKGGHTWTWDGYTNAGVLDTYILKHGPISVDVTVTDAATGFEFSAMKILKSDYKDFSWINIRLDRTAKKVGVNVYMKFESPDKVSIGGLVPLPFGDSMSVSPTIFGEAKGLIKEGVQKYWSRRVEIQGEQYEVDTTVVERDKRSITTLIVQALETSLPGGVGKRSFNLATFGEGQPVVCIHHQDHYVNNPEYYKRESRMTGAHELGHSVLRAYVSVNHSLTHKGTSNALQQTEASAPVYPAHPAEIDLMLYLNGTKPYYGSDGVTLYGPGCVYDRTRAVAADVIGLIAIARVTFSN